jgi:hypothetical protein
MSMSEGARLQAGLKLVDEALAALRITRAEHVRLQNIMIAIGSYIAEKEALKDPVTSPAVESSTPPKKPSK